MYLFLIPGEDSSSMEIITMPTTRSRSPNTSTYLVLVAKLPRITQQSDTGWKHSCTHTEKKKSKISSDSVYQFLMVNKCPQDLM